jgi:hypothetical protein
VKRILDGEKPSDIFKALLRDKPSLTNGELALDNQLKYWLTQYGDLK